jgi:beta-lactamase class A
MPRRPPLPHRFRRAVLPGVVAALVAGTVALSSAPGGTTSPVAAGTSASFVQVSDEAGSSAAVAEVDAAAAAAGGTVSVVVLDADGDLVLSSGADESTYTASLVKLLVVARLMELDACGELSLTVQDVELMEAAVTNSDDDAMSALWVEYDGDRLVTDLSAELGLTGTAAPEDAGQWGQTTTTAADLATFLSSLDEVLDDGDSATLLEWMRSATDTAADGFDQTFGLLSGSAGEDVAVKQGWMTGADDARQLHSVGVLADGTVAVLLGEFPASTSWADARAALDAAAAAVVA